MPEVQVPLALILRELGSGLCLGEVLFVPELSTVGRDPERVAERLLQRAARLLRKDTAWALHHRLPAGPLRVEEVRLSLDPPRGSPAWQEPLALRFHAVRWSHGASAELAYVPALGIEVLVERQDAELMLTELEAEVRRAIERFVSPSLLAELVARHRDQVVQVRRVEVAIDVPSPRRRAMEESERKEVSILKQVATDLRRAALEPAWELDEQVRRIAEVLAGRRPRSVLLVGPSGVGKTAAFHELVRRRAEVGLGEAPFWATSGSRLVAGMSGFGEWQERCERLRKEAARTKAVLHLGALIELAEVGRSIHNAQGVASFLRPHLARGELLGVAECTPEQAALLERDQPQLVQAFVRLDVNELPAERARRVLDARAALLLPRTGVTLEPGALEATDRLHRRYATYSIQPARSLRFLERLARSRPRDERVDARAALEAFGRETGLPPFLLREDQPLDLAATRACFESQVVGQPDAMRLVVDLLARIKAGLSRPKQPLCTLLLAGPTGVGKTETARALAAFLFGDRDRLVRIDLSEFQDPLAVARLTGGVDGEGQLTSRVRERPFGVVLLDELEKAHPLVFDLLLQVLGEARLTDARGRLADFTGSVVIMTSNLGAETFQHGGLGFGEGSHDVGGAFSEAVRAFFRPELVNRIDRVVPFAPLGPAVVEQIAARELSRVALRDGVRHREVRLRVAPEVAGHLAREGSDARWGARHLKRLLERQVVVPLAEQLARYGHELPLEAEVGLSGATLSVAVRPAALARRGGLLGVQEETTSLVRRASALRRKTQRLARSPAAISLDNELTRLERQDARLRRRRRGRPEAHAAPDVELLRLRDLTGARGELGASIEALEEELLLSVLGPASERAGLSTGDAAARLEALQADWWQLLLRLHTRHDRGTDERGLTLAVYGEDPGWLRQLAQGYVSAFERLGQSVTCFRVVAGQNAVTRAPEANVFAAPDASFLRDDAPLVGAVFRVTGPLVAARLEPERGLHVLVREKKRVPCLVETATLEVFPDVDPLAPSDDPRTGVMVAARSGHTIAAIKRYRDLTGASLRDAKAAVDAALADGTRPGYVPPQRIERQGAIGKQTLRRTYDPGSERIDDPLLEPVRRAFPGALGDALAALVEDHLRKVVEEQLAP